MADGNGWDLRWFAPGLPQPGGSKRAFINKYTGRAAVTEDAKRNKDWRAVVALTASQVANGLLEGPLEVRFDFIFPRPKGHYGSGKNADKVKASAPPYPAVKPDVTKLIRSTEDALKAIVWHDDNQIVSQMGTKRYGEQPGAWITIRRKP